MYCFPFGAKQPIFRGKLAVSFREGREYFQQKQNGSSEVLAKKQLLKEWLRGGLTTKNRCSMIIFLTPKLGVEPTTEQRRKTLGC